MAAAQRLFRYTAIIGSVFFLISMAAVIYFGINKTIEIANVAQDSVGSSEAPAPEEEAAREPNTLVFEDGENTADYLCIPLADKLEAEKIRIENHYMDSELVILMEGVEPGFYAVHALTGNRSSIRNGVFEDTEEGVKLELAMDGIHEYRTVLENNNLYITFLNPREIYDRIVVIDPLCGGADIGNRSDGLTEKELTLDIAKRLKTMLDASDVKAYYTRIDDVNPSVEDRVALANETKADMYVMIGAESNDDPSVYGITAAYNDEYFIPGFGSIELSDLLVRNVTTDVRGKALGLRKASETEYALRHATVPAAMIGVGMVSNPQEVILLKRDDYREKIATGIYHAIMEAYEE
ncbi:MAG: N-acetylmuramoyl-L-alanine amidase [Lachnospiraceae bacterium]|nr:N-acetylmuramoyl-L-alanine amidase [Lachnospiraceae bacterium]